MRKYKISRITSSTSQIKDNNLEISENKACFITDFQDFSTVNQIYFSKKNKIKLKKYHMILLITGI